MAGQGSKTGIFQRIAKFLRESWMEIRKTSWPDSEELTRSTLLVLAAVLIVAVWIGLLDWLFGIATKRIVGW